VGPQLLETPARSRLGPSGKQGGWIKDGVRFNVDPHLVAFPDFPPLPLLPTQGIIIYTKGNIIPTQREESRMERFI
jgi:hypothetical protein